MLKRKRLTKLSKSVIMELVASGLPGGIRTPDPRFRRPLFYPAELRADLQMVAAEGLEPTHRYR